jgi:hypothetical protein
VGSYHTLEGLLMMGFGLLLLNSECWILDQVCRIVSDRQQGSPKVDPSAAARPLACGSS